MNVSIDLTSMGSCKTSHPALEQLLSNQYFRTGDTTMTYRQVDLLENAGLLNAEKDGKWQKFDTKDLVYLQVISELKQLGFLNQQLEAVESAFYTDGHFADMPDGKPVTNLMDFALCQIFNGIPWVLIVKQNGEVHFTERGRYDYAEDKGECWICVDLYSIMTKIGERLTKQDTKSVKISPLTMVFESLLRDKKFTDLGREFLSILRNAKYQQITIVKKDGGDVLVQAKNTRSSCGKDILEVIGSIERRDFQKIEVTDRKRKVVCFSHTDIFKGKYIKSLGDVGHVNDSG